MGKKSKTETQAQVVTIDGVEYDAASLSKEQVTLFNHVLDLDRKIETTVFNLDQLQVGRNAFFGMLKESLVKKED